MRLLFLLFIFSFCFSQYVIVEKATPSLIKIYTPRGYVENPYKLRIFLLNNGTKTLEIYNLSVEDGYHNWSLLRENPTRIPPGYLGILVAETYLSCQDFGKSFIPIVRINTSGGEITEEASPFTAESPIEAIYPLAIASEIGVSKRKIISFINRGELEKNVNPKLTYPTQKMFVRLISDNFIIPNGMKNIYFEVVPYYSGFLGEINISFQTNCPYLISPQEIFIKVKGIYKEEFTSRILLASEINPISILLFIFLLVIVGRAAGI